MRIVIVEDSALVRDNLLALLADHPSLAVIGTAAGEDEAYQLITRTRPDTVLLDLALSPGSGMSLLRKLRATAGLAPRVVILSNQPADPYKALCRDGGADAFFDKCGELSGLLAQLASWMPPLPPNELERLNRLTRLQVLDTPAEESFDAIARIAAAITQAPIGLISLVDADRQWFKARVGLEASETSRSVSFCAHALLTHDLLEIEDATQDPRFADSPLVRRNRYFAAGVGVAWILGTSSTRVEAAE